MTTHRIIISAFLLLAAQTLWAQRLLELDISVTLKEDGTARITEQRTMDVTDKGTECYIAIGNLGSMELSDFSVSEQGHSFRLTSLWSVDASREAKTDRYGLVTKPDGYELCWGLGAPGHHVYNVSYRLSGLVQRYSDADGFVYMFVNPGIRPKPEHVRLTFYGPSVPLTKDNCKAWAFGFHGDVAFTDSGTVVISSTEGLGDVDRVIVMMQFPKGFLTPAIAGEGSFSDRKAEAMEGSSYQEDDGLDPLERFSARVGRRLGVDSDTADILLFGILGLIIALFVKFRNVFTYLFTLKPLRRSIRRRRLIGNRESLPWNRQLPYGGGLVRSNQVLNALSSKLSPNFRGVVSAIILRLIYKKALVIDAQSHKLRIGEFVNGSSPKEDISAERDIYNILKKAAGDNKRLDEGELKAWTEKHRNADIASLQQLRQEAGGREMSKDEVRQLFGLKKFLEDFTLVGERGAMEVQLWNEYLVFATLFGIAEQVLRDFRIICPEYFELSDVSQVVSENVSVLDAYDVLLSSFYLSSFIEYSRSSSALSAMAERFNGGGGLSSLGGGCGFSGGGSGGGVR